MSNYPVKALATVLIVVAGAEVSRTANAEWNKQHPKEKPRNVSVMQPVIGGFTLGVFLFAAGMASEYLAGLLCLLIAVGSLLRNGQNLLAVLTPLTK